LAPVSTSVPRSVFCTPPVPVSAEAIVAVMAAPSAVPSPTRRMLGAPASVIGSPWIV
jgi:hypothetical protein